MRPLLGTYVEVGTEDNGAETDASLSEAFAAIEKIHSLLSFHDPESELSRLNSSPGQEIELHPLSLKVLRLAKAVSRASGGLFDPTVGGELQRLGRLPGAHPELGSGSCDDIEITGRVARLRRPVRVVLDGIAKGFAVDCAIDVMKNKGLASGWVNAGGDVRVFGDTILPIKIRGAKPDAPLLGLRESALATSVVSREPSIEFPGWIVSARSGAEPRRGVWSVQAATAWRADALTKVASLADDDSRDALVRRLGGVWVQVPEEPGR